MSHKQIPTPAFELKSISGKQEAVAAQHPDAVEAGLEMLKKGGTATDAAIAAAMVLNIVEPWSSGIGGGGFLLNYDVASKKTECINFHVKTPKKININDFKQVEEQMVHDIFSMPKIKGNANMIGPKSVCIPGFLKGMDTAHKRYGRLKWYQIMAPAVRLAQKGHLIKHWSVVQCSNRARFLKTCPVSTKLWLPGGLPICTFDDRKYHYVKLERLAHTLELIQKHGAQVFYSGRMAEAWVEDLQRAGSAITLEDVQNYQAFVEKPLSFEYGDFQYHVPANHAAGLCIKEVMESLKNCPKTLEKNSEHKFYTQVASALKTQDDVRLTQYGDQYFSQMQHEKSCTSHISVVDKQGNMVSLTNTLLSIFGSGVTSETSGVLMNNGVYWMMPTPHHPNKIKGEAYPLSNMCPMIATKKGQGCMAIGGAGGRRIMPAVLQATLFAHRYGIETKEILKLPRIDTSEYTRLVIDDRLDDETKKNLKQRWHCDEYGVCDNDYGFGVLSLVKKEDTGGVSGAVCPYHPLSCVKGNT